jgi:hypothetical protein
MTARHRQTSDHLAGAARAPVNPLRPDQVQNDRERLESRGSRNRFTLPMIADLGQSFPGCQVYRKLGSKVNRRRLTGEDAYRREECDGPDDYL